MLLTVEEAAILCRCCVRTLRRRIQDKQLRIYGPGRQLLRIEDLDLPVDVVDEFRKTWKEGVRAMASMRKPL